MVDIRPAFMFHTDMNSGRVNLPDSESIRRAVCSDLAALDERHRLSHDRAEPLHDPATLLRELGWSGVSLPEQYGGRNLGALGRMIAISEAARLNSSLGASLSAATLGQGLLAEFGSPEQREHWLPLLASGEDIMTICMTEPESGSHLLGMRACAIGENDGWRISGRKWFIGNSHIATVHGVIAATDSAKGSKSLSAFVVPANCVGCDTGVLHELDGLRGFSLGEVKFQECFVPRSNLVGNVGSGLAYAHSVVTRHGKLNIGSVALGIAEASLDLATSYVKERHLYGAPLSRLESVQRQLADMYAAVQSSRLALMTAAQKLDAGRSADAELLLGKLLASEAAKHCATSAVELMGARGVHASEGAMQLVSDALMTLAPSGTSDVQRKRLAQLALGVYRPTIGRDGATIGDANA